MNTASYGRQESLMTDDDSQKLQLFISCRKLADLDFITVTDSFLIVRMMQPNKPLREILRTKVYENDLNPNYAESVIIDYFFEIRQKLVFQVYHFDKPPKLVGKMQTTVGEIFGSPSNGLKRPLINKQNKPAGQIIVRVEKVQKMANQIITMNISAKNLPESSFLCFFYSINPFFRIFRKRQNEDLLVYESQTIKNNPDPRFKPVTLHQRKLCRNNEQLPFEIRFYDYSSNGSHKFIGTTTAKICDLVQNKTNFQVIKNDRMHGLCMITGIKRTMKYQFGDYISAGLQLALINCIDFTASNGVARDPNSLHYVSSNKMSQYEQALYEVSKILLDYDYDKLVPVYGFGAKVRMPNYNTNGKVHHCFPLNGLEQNANVFQVDGIMRAYRQALPYLQFSGPTMFNFLLANAINQARECQRDNNQYLVVFILTDGQIHDKAQVIDQIIECCSLPISLIIVGVGNGDFTIMNQLDDDDCKLVDRHGKKTTRDCVQFVQFKEFKNNSVELAKQVLQQLPRQVQEYYQMMGIAPNQLKNVMYNEDIQMAAQNLKRDPNYQPNHANMNGSLHRQATWQQPYFHQNSLQIPPPPNYSKR